MKKIITLALGCITLSAVAAFGQTHTQSLSFDDGNGTGNAGTYNSNDTFSFDINLTYAGYSSYGLSLWFETEAAAHNALIITNFTYGTTFADPTQPGSTPVGFTVLANDGGYVNPQPSDFGATTTIVDPAHAVPPGTYFVGHITISITGLAPGTYILESAATGAPGLTRQSEVTDTDFQDNNIPNSIYTITIVPEPSTYALCALGAIGLGIVAYRRHALSA